ncbi:MAG TPA: MFS transporter [Anaerolineales bacterium]|nr:MFS transporter [Anaerolineales bacterium]
MDKYDFPWKRALTLGIGYLGISAFWPIFNQFIPLFLQAGNPDFNASLIAANRPIPNVEGFGLAPGLAMFIMTWDNLINIFVQPWAGAKSDLTWNRFGRRKGWILLGAPAALIGFLFIPTAQSVFAIMVFILITNIGMALYRSPTAAWLGDLFQAKERSRVNGLINLMGGVGGLLAYFGGGYLFNQYGRSAPFVWGSITTFAAILVIIFFIKEPRRIDFETAETVNFLKDFLKIFRNSNRNKLIILVSILLWFISFSALETGLSSIAVFSLGIEAGTASIVTGSMTLSFILCAFPSGLLGTRWGLRRTILVGLAGLTAMLLVGFFIARNIFSLVFVLVVCGFFWALVNVNSLPLVLDQGDEKRSGASTGNYYFASQLAAVVGPTLGGVLVGVLGQEYRWLWLFSTFFMGLAFWMMTRVQYTNK